MTSAPEKPGKPQKPKKWKWLKRFCIAMAVLLAALLIFHQPLLMAALRFAIARFAASQHLSVQYEVEGHALSRLTFRNMRISPAGRTPVEKITIAEIRAEYSVADLLRIGSKEFVKSVVVKDANLIFKDLNDAESRKPHPSHLGTDLHVWLFPPVTFLGSLDAENVNITARNDGGDFTLESGNVRFERGKPGSISIARMHIPNLKAWANLAGQLTVTEKDFTIENLAISSDVFVEKLVSAPAETDGKPATLSLQGKLFGGPLSANYSSTKHGEKAEAKLEVSASNTGIPGLERFLDSKTHFSGGFDHIDFSCSGDPGIPSSWSGTIITAITSPVIIGPLKIDTGDAKLVLDHGNAKLDAALTSGDGANKLTGEAQGRMPGRLKEFPSMTLDGHYRIAANDMGRGFDGLTHGTVLADGHFNLQEGTLSSDVVASATEINSEQFDVSQMDVKAEITKSLRPREPLSEYLDDTGGRLTVHFQQARLGKYALDSGSLTAEVKDGWLRLDAPDLKRESDTASLNADCHVPRDFSKLPTVDFDAKFSVSAPNAAAFNAAPDLKGINGQFEANGDISRRAGQYDGNIQVNGTKLAIPDFTAESLAAAIIIKKSVADVGNFLLVIDVKNRIAAGGKFDLRKPHTYEGSIDANIADLAVFNPILQTAGVTDKIGGALVVNWKGAGSVNDIQHTGAGSLKLTGGKYGDFQPIMAEISGNYSPQAAQIPVIRVRVDKTDFTAQLDLRDTVLQIHDILLQQQNVKLLQGELVLPVDFRTPSKPDSIIPADGRVFANLTSDEINLETLLLRPKQTSPLKGMMRVSVNADGTLDKLPANVLLRIRNLQAKAAPGVAPGNFELSADLKENQLTLHGGFQQPAITLLQIDGKLPFSPNRILREGKIDEQSPVDISVKLEKSPVTIIGQLIPSVRYIEGQMGIDAKATGTIAKPQLSGAVTLDLPAIRLKDPAAPAVNGFKGNLEFTGNQLLVRNFGGEISGGPFNLTGRMLFEKLDAPVLDMRLVSSNALVLRNETVTVRADSDLKIAGIFNAAHVTGSVALTKSKFFREVEILPIELPGRPAPKPPGEMESGFSLKPPFANWTFDVAVKTKDPFLVRGNLANGAAHIDLKLAGTGASPTLAGLVRIDNFVASLPFSRLNIDYGYLYFSAENPFVPTLDIQGSSSLRDYNIHVYISGTPSEPVSVFTSDPPLPQEEIIALLGTGATSGELTSNSDVLAGRAVVLVFQNFYHKLFKQKPQETQSFLTRFELDPGAVDPRTGKQEVSARFKATDHIQITGDIDAEGGLRGQVRYLIRFR